MSRPGRKSGAGATLRTVLLVGLAALVIAPDVLAAQDRLVRRFTGEGDPPAVVALAQDSTGFLWAGSRAGLFRYDGGRFERWAPDVLPRAVGSLAVAAGRIVVVDAEGRIVEVTRDGGRVLPGAARRSPNYTDILAFDASGRLWAVGLEGELQWLDDAEWRGVDATAFRGDTVRKVFPGGESAGVVVATGAGLWRVLPGATPARLLAGHRIISARPLPGGGLLALATSGDVLRVEPDGRHEVVLTVSPSQAGRAIAIAEHEGMVWIGTDRSLIAAGPEGEVEVLGSRHGVTAGGPLLVDHEGSLWHAGFSILTQFPEPRTRVWNEQHGLPSNLARFLGRSGNTVWVTTWQGTGTVHVRDGRWEAAGSPARLVARLCPDGSGGLFAGSPAGTHHLRGLEATLVDSGSRTAFLMCSSAAGGGIWVATPGGPHLLSEDGASLTPVRSFPPGEGGGRSAEVVLEDGSGRLWVGSRERVCHARAAAVRSTDDAEWTCDALPAGTVHLTGLAELESGAIWAVSNTVGVLRHDGAGWAPLADNARLPTRSLLNIVNSPRGGVWLVGTGVVQRVEESADGRGWTVAERLGAWHGLPTVGGADLLEEQDGTIWIATAGGVVHVPASVRTAEPDPPRVVLVEARVDGRRLPLTDRLVLPADRNRLELRFAALTYREPGRIRYQVRLSPDDDWADTDGQPFFNWVDLPAGRHRPQLRASLDGLKWSPEPAELAFRVLPAWYRTDRAIVVFALLATTLLFGLYRARLAYLLGLERQRTRIAMDLHDEMGSGLASIGILAGVLSDGESGSAAGSSARQDSAAGDGRRIAREVATTAEELGTALSDIVWSLDPHRSTLEELAARLAEHGGRLFADEVRFDTRFPSTWPAGSLPLPVLRNVLLIGLEAMHNAARHAGASHVVLALEPQAGGWWLSVQDDGVGLTQQPGQRGRGLRTMRRRVAEIEGRLVLEARPDEGTTVRLWFSASRQRPRWLARLAPLAGRRAPGPGVDATTSHEHAVPPAGRVVHR